MLTRKQKARLRNAFDGWLYSRIQAESEEQWGYMTPAGKSQLRVMSLEEHMEPIIREITEEDL